MRIAGFGCSGCGLFLGLIGLAVIAAAFIPGIVNGSETGTAIAIGGSACAAAVLPMLIGIASVVVGGKKDENTGA